MYTEEIRPLPVDSYDDVRTLVRGLPYQCPEDWQDVLSSLDENCELYLVKEPDNPKDEFAIAAYLDDRRIGYVSADDNCKVWMFLSDKRTPCKVIQKYEASFKVSFENPRPLFESMAFEDIYKDKDGWVEKNRPIMEVPFLTDAEDNDYDWYRDIVVIRDFEEFVPDFRRKLAAKLIVFFARKNSQGNYRYYIPYINAAVAVVEDEMIKEFIDKDGFVIAIPEMSSKTYPGGIHICLNIARLHPNNPLITKFKSIEQDGDKELVFYLKSASPLEKVEDMDSNNAQSEVADKNSDELSIGEINRDYFDKIDRLTTDIDKLVRDDLILSRRVLRKMHKHPHYGYHYDDIKEYISFVKLFVMKDLCHIYKELNGSISLSKNEGKILFLYALKVLGEKRDFSFEMFKELCNPNTTIEMIKEYRKVVENFIKQQYEEQIPYYPKNDFLMHEVLEDANIELMDRAIEYKELMCQFATSVADAKGKISTKERKWLSNLASQI